MLDISKIFYLLALVFLAIGFVFNFLWQVPRIPGDIYIDKPGLKIYIPFASALILSAVLTVIFNFFKK